MLTCIFNAILRPQSQNSQIRQDKYKIEKRGQICGQTSLEHV